MQTGFCRTGDWFACEHEGVVPDLVTTAKGIAGGLPLSAVTGRAEIMDAVQGRWTGRHLRGQPACLRRRSRRHRDHERAGSGISRSFAR
ncbi:MAG: aminotransferase class III-fold pyridoxal phosphate-dependent enzyme [Nocardioidaceae bacterium]